MIIRYNKSHLICILLLLPFLEPLLFKYDQYAIIDYCYSIAKLISFFIILFATFLHKVKINKIICLIFLYEFILGLSTIYNQGDFISYCGPAVNVLGLSLITNYYFPKIKLNYIKCLYIILFVLVLINAVFIIIKPTGFIPLRFSTDAIKGFLGIENRYVFFLLPLIFYASLYSIIKHKKLNNIFYISAFISLFSIIKTWSVGAMLGMILLILFLIIFIAKDKKSIIRNLDFKYYFLVIVFLNISIVLFHIQDLFASFIVKYLHKDITLTARTLVWPVAIKLIQKNFAFGIGIQYSNYLKNNLLGVQHPHNLFLSILLTSGFVGFIVYIMIFLTIDKNTKNLHNKRVKFIFNISIFILLFMSLADTIDTGLFFTMYIVAAMYQRVMEKDQIEGDI